MKVQVDVAKHDNIMVLLIVWKKQYARVVFLAFIAVLVYFYMDQYLRVVFGKIKI
jgi:hypothetical protein